VIVEFGVTWPGAGFETFHEVASWPSNKDKHFGRRFSHVGKNRQWRGKTVDLGLHIAAVNKLLIECIRRSPHEAASTPEGFSRAPDRTVEFVNAGSTFESLIVKWVFFAFTALIDRIELSASANS